MATKIIVTLKSPLLIKYGVNFPVLEALFNKLIAADAKKNLITTVVYLDDPATSAKYRYALPSDFGERVCKKIVDEIYLQEQPEYLAIFGAQDVFPFQQLINPLSLPQVAAGQPRRGDPDEWILSDLPYACDSSYSTDYNSFTNPTRVVGRIPDRPGPGDLSNDLGDIDFVATIIQQIIDATPADPSVCATYFANSAYQWSRSTQLSLRNIFGSAIDMKTSPPDNTGAYSKTDVSPLTHFFNLHGSLGRAIFFGQQGGQYPPAITPNDIIGNINPGCFVAAECCYGAQLLSSTLGPGIAETYLSSKASVFMGSSTVSYGPAAGQGLADLITQYFMINVLKGASSGRALLSARQKFISVSGPTLDAHELKTLAQFYILGDPSVQPVLETFEPEMVDSIEDRRFNLAAKGIQLGLSTPNTILLSDTDSHYSTKTFVIPADIQLPEGFDLDTVKMVFETDDAVSFANIKYVPTKSNEFGDDPLKVRYHVYQKGNVLDSGINEIEALVVKERENIVLGYRRYYSR